MRADNRQPKCLRLPYVRDHEVTVKEISAGIMRRSLLERSRRDLVETVYERQGYLMITSWVLKYCSSIVCDFRQSMIGHEIELVSNIRKAFD